MTPRGVPLPLLVRETVLDVLSERCGWDGEDDPPEWHREVAQEVADRIGRDAP